MQNRKFMSWLLCSAMLLMAGCATTPQVLELDLNPTVPPISVAPPVPVALRVQDKRPETVIGYQTNENGQNQGPIVARGDVSQTIYAALAEGLRKEGFIPRNYTASSQQGPRLTVMLDRLNYSRNHGQIAVVAKLEAHVETTRKKARFTYTVKRTKGHDLLHSKKENRKLINAALTEALTNLLNDQKLIAIMTGRGMDTR